jgi:hypothetical protein
MSIEKVHLRKLLRLFYAAASERRAILGADIYSEQTKKDGDDEEGGGDFHGPFWADAKRHVEGIVDLPTQTKTRIAKNARRRNLYPLLTQGFLAWRNEKRRWRNEDFILIQDVKGRVAFPELNGLVKVENLLAVRVENRFSRIVCPYFSEEPLLPPIGARLGLWLMSEALPRYPIEDLRILDVLRGKSFGVIDVGIEGDERAQFTAEYARVLEEWRKLKEERQVLVAA